MGNKNIKSNIDPDLIQLINDNKNLKHVLRNPHFTLLERFIISWCDHPIPKYNLLQRLIMYSDNFLIKKYLINNIYKYKKEIDFQSGLGRTALIMACRNLNTYSDNGIVKLLLENEADINLKDIDGCTALMMACYYSNYSNVETVKLLLENNADPNLKNNNGRNALMIACGYTNIVSSIEIVKLLLENGADPNLKDNNGRTALMDVCRYTNTESSIEIFKILLENGTDPNLKDNNGLTALMYVCRYSNTESSIEIVKILLNQNNIDVNIIDKNNKYNTLMILCKFNPNQHEIAKLLKSKINLNHKNYQNKKNRRYLFTRIQKFIH